MTSLNLSSILAAFTLCCAPACDQKPSQAEGASANASALTKTEAPAPEQKAPGVAERPADRVQGEAVPSRLLAGCQELCAKTQSLKCTAASECVKLCDDLESESAAHCNPAAEAAIACMLGQPSSTFECNEEGLASIKDGFCDAEQKSLANCLAGGPSH